MSDGERAARPHGGDRRPSISAIPYREVSGGKISYLLGEPERISLARIASRVRFGRGTLIYRQGEPVRAVYNISSGVVRTSQTATDGSRSIAAFLFPDDLFGLAEEGAYVNTAAAVTAVTAWRMPVTALEALLRRNPTLEWHFLVKLCRELREAQRHVLILARRRALTRLALFVLMLARSQEACDETETDLYLPMTRSDIADYLGLTLAAVSRSFRRLQDRGLVRFMDRRHLQILDRARLQELVMDDAAASDIGK